MRLEGITRPLSVEETTVADIHAALDERRLTCVEIVQAHLDRIAAFDTRGPALRAIITINPNALEEAAGLDRRLAAGEAPSLPLRGVPVIVKDNVDTGDMPTTGGSRALAASRPPDDAFVVAQLRQAGAIVIGKSNLTELARGGVTVSSLGGQTRNPYDLARTPGGSSGGTGAAIAASFGVLGVGSDTLQSVRSPASAQSLVGLRPTRGLVSRDGVIPYSATQDEVGPIARTVDDVARMLDVMAGVDPADPITARGKGRAPQTYTASFDVDGLRGVRIGVLTAFFGTEDVHAPVNRVMDAAMAAMRRAGAMFTPIEIPNLVELTTDTALTHFESRAACDHYFESLGPAAPVKSLAALFATGTLHPFVRDEVEADIAVVDGTNAEEYRRRLQRREDLRRAILAVMTAERLDAILYPHQRRLVAAIGDAQLERNGVLSNATGLPALTLPGGFSDPTGNAPLGVPVGVELLGVEWSEPALLRLGFAFEQATQFRKPPPFTRWQA